MDGDALSDGGGEAVDTVLDGLRELGGSLPFNRHLGVEVQELAVGRCRTLLPADDRLHNHLGGVHAIAELAPVELAGALAASSRLAPLVARGFVPVLAGLSVRYQAPAHGPLVATAEVPEGALEAAVAAERAGERPRVEVEVEVTDEAGSTVAVTRLYVVYLTPDEVGGAG